MKNLILIYILVSIVSGCGTISVKNRVLKDYKALDPSTFSGVTSQQAKLIAQKEVIDRMLDLSFKLEEPKIVQGPKKAPDIDKYWFVRFDEAQRSTIPYILMVVIEKDNGQVRIVDDYPADKDWVLESAVYRLKIQDK